MEIQPQAKLWSDKLGPGVLSSGCETAGRRNASQNVRKERKNVPSQIWWEEGAKGF